jgi:hypothetical protein
MNRPKHVLITGIDKVDELDLTPTVKEVLRPVMLRPVMLRPVMLRPVMLQPVGPTAVTAGRTRRQQGACTLFRLGPLALLSSASTHPSTFPSPLVE